MGTSTFLPSLVATTDETTWKGSGMTLRFFRSDLLDLVEETVRDLRAMASPFAEVTVLAFACEVTDRAGLAGRKRTTGEPEGSPTRSAADERGCAARRLRQSRCVRGVRLGPPSPCRCWRRCKFRRTNMRTKWGRSKLRYLQGGWT